MKMNKKIKRKLFEKSKKKKTNQIRRNLMNMKH